MQSATEKTEPTMKSVLTSSHVKATAVLGVAAPLAAVCGLVYGG